MNFICPHCGFTWDNKSEPCTKCFDEYMKLQNGSGSSSIIFEGKIPNIPWDDIFKYANLIPTIEIPPFESYSYHNWVNIPILKPKTPYERFLDEFDKMDLSSLDTFNNDKSVIAWWKVVLLTILIT